MKNMQFLELMNSIDEEIILEADKATTKKHPKSVLLKQITAAACIVAILSVGIAVTLQQSRSMPSQNNSTNTDISFWGLYSSYKYTSFALGKFKNIVGCYNRGTPESYYHEQQNLIVEFEVIEDYYEKLEKGTTFLVPFRLDHLTEEDVRQLISTNDQFILHSYIYRDYQKYHDVNTNETIGFDNITEQIRFNNYSLIPIQNGRINIKELDQMVTEYYEHYTPFDKDPILSRYIAHGMSVEEAGNNLKTLYQMWVETDGGRNLPRDPNVDY